MEAKYRYRWQGEGKNRTRKENPDIADSYNTVLKIAKKRAQVDATLTVTAASDIFAPEPEDGVDDERPPASDHPQPTEHETLVYECGQMATKLGGDAAKISAVTAEAGVQPGKRIAERTVDELRKIKAALEGALKGGVAMLLLAFALFAQSVVIDNQGKDAVTSWVFCGLPVQDLPAAPAGELVDQRGLRHVYVTGQRGIRIRAEKIPPGRSTMRWPKAPPAADPAVEFRLHPGIDLWACIPRWWIDAELSDQPSYRLIESDAAHQVWHLRAMHRERHLVHDLWATIWSDTQQIDWVTHSVYGTAEPGQAQQVDLTALWLVCRAPMSRRFSREAGIGHAHQNADGTWAQLLAAPTTITRAARIQTRGTWYPDSRTKANIPPLTAIYTGWDGRWLALGAVPVAPRDADADLVATRAAYERAAYRGYWSARPFVQPIESWTTGEQPGFGASVLGRAVTLHEPWFVDAMLWSSDAYAYRPTANKEPDGSPMRASLHKDTRTMGQRPDFSWTAQDQRDRLGWPVPSTWPYGPTTSDDQHRDAATLHGMVALTDCPALRSIVEDHVELAATDFYRAQGWVRSPRAIGRVLLDYAGQSWLGHGGARAAILAELDAVGAGSVFVVQPRYEAFLVGPLEEAKYGWPVGRGWQPWQQAIAMIGLEAAYRRTGDERARTWAVRAAQTVVRWAFFERAGKWVHVYAIAWNDGRLPPDSAFDGTVNSYVYPDPACDYWSLAACEFLAAREPRTDLGRKAQAILDAWGAPRDWQQSQWRAIR